MYIRYVFMHMSGYHTHMYSTYLQVVSHCKLLSGLLTNQAAYHNLTVLRRYCLADNVCSRHQRSTRMCVCLHAFTISFASKQD
jgi:hypothetical protein